MEYASLLAGERWSDHPNCTHPLVARIARAVNDYSSDESRSKLVALIPSVIGLNGDDPTVDVRIAMRSAATALPVAAEYRQKALAAGLFTARRVLADQARLDDPTGLEGHVDNALSRAPQAASWAEDFTAEYRPKLRVYSKRAAPDVVRVSLAGIAEAAVSDPDGLLFELLETVIKDCEHWLGKKTSVGSFAHIAPHTA